jgi:putative zinc finger protein
MNGIQPSSCVRARQWISLALDRELSEFERFLMEDHVKRCADCSEFERDTRQFTVGMRSAPLESLSAPVRVARHRQPARFGRLGLANVVPVAVAAASVFVATTFLPERAGIVSDQRTLESAVAIDSMTVNELVLEVRRRNLQEQAQSAVHRVGDIGAVTASLSGSSN